MKILLKIWTISVLWLEQFKNPKIWVFVVSWWWPVKKSLLTTYAEKKELCASKLRHFWIFRKNLKNKPKIAILNPSKISTDQCCVKGNQRCFRDFQILISTERELKHFSIRADHYWLSTWLFFENSTFNTLEVTTFHFGQFYRFWFFFKLLTRLEWTLLRRNVL